MSNINVEKFIDDIYERPNIWNRSYAGNKQYLDETWNELSQIHQIGSMYNNSTCLCRYLIICHLPYIPKQYLYYTYMYIHTNLSFISTFAIFSNTIEGQMERIT